MEGKGIGFIVWDGGWACSDDVIFDIERDPDPSKNNLITTNTLKYNFIFEGAGEITKDLEVFCLFKSEGKKYGFTGIIRGKAGDLTVVNITAKSDYIQEIISKIRRKIK